MDVRIETAPMAAEVQLVQPSLVTTSAIHKTLSLVERVVSFSCPSLGSHSISAVAPDTFFEGGLANAA